MNGKLLAGLAAVCIPALLAVSAFRLTRPTAWAEGSGNRPRFEYCDLRWEHATDFKPRITFRSSSEKIEAESWKELVEKIGKEGWNGKNGSTGVLNGLGDLGWDLVGVTETSVPEGKGRLVDRTWIFKRSK